MIDEDTIVQLNPEGEPTAQVLYRDGKEFFKIKDYPIHLSNVHPLAILLLPTRSIKITTLQKILFKKSIRISCFSNPATCPFHCNLTSPH